MIPRDDQVLLLEELYRKPRRERAVWLSAQFDNELKRLYQFAVDSQLFEAAAEINIELKRRQKERQTDSIVEL